MKNKMTAADWLAERRRIEQAATEGPWRAAVVARYVDDDGCERGKGGIYPAGPSGPPPLFVTPDWLAADAEFLAHARADVPALVAEVRRLRSLETRVTMLAASWHYAWPGQRVDLSKSEQLRAALDGGER